MTKHHLFMFGVLALFTPKAAAGFPHFSRKKRECVFVRRKAVILPFFLNNSREVFYLCVGVFSFWFIIIYTGVYLFMRRLSWFSNSKIRAYVLRVRRAGFCVLEINYTKVSSTMKPIALACALAALA